MPSRSPEGQSPQHTQKTGLASASPVFLLYCSAGAPNSLSAPPAPKASVMLV